MYPAANDASATVGDRKNPHSAKRVCSSDEREGALGVIILNACWGAFTTPQV